MKDPLKEIVIIYHGDCLDGFGGAYAAWKKFGDTASYVEAYDHNSLPVPLMGKELYIIDFSFREPLLRQLNKQNKSVVVIDHHQTAEAEVTAYPQNIFDNNHSGAVLAWQYFHPDTAVPIILQYVEDHDLWRFALPEHREFTVSLHQEPQTFVSWEELSQKLAAPDFLINFIARGTLLATFEDKLTTSLLKHRERVLFEGHEVWAINESLYRSTLGNQLAALNEADGGIALGIVYYRKDKSVRVSLRSKGDVDVATMAEKYGGGGHKNAASIKVKSFQDLPFTFLA
jgi:nanoRNase/pAp phosphatase (c-di-AMP/oligoRNAs hydrolase)